MSGRVWKPGSYQERWSWGRGCLVAVYAPSLLLLTLEKGLYLKGSFLAWLSIGTNPLLGEKHVQAVVGPEMHLHRNSV